MKTFEITPKQEAALRLVLEHYGDDRRVDCLRELVKSVVVMIGPQRIPLAAGEHYVGAIQDNGIIDHHVVLMPYRSDPLPLHDALIWARSVGGELPSTRELSLIAANAKGQLKEDWFWSWELHDGAQAWAQHCGSGKQAVMLKKYGACACAVRRVSARPEDVAPQELPSQSWSTERELEVQRLQVDALRTQIANMELDLRRVLNGEATICDFGIVKEVEQRLKPFGLSA